MRKLLVGQAQFGDSQARYYLLEGEYGGSYGVQVELGDEAAVVPALSHSRPRVEALAEALVRGGVTPVALLDVVNDWLLE